jgi:hypothetical protein
MLNSTAIVVNEGDLCTSIEVNARELTKGIMTRYTVGLIVILFVVWSCAALPWPNKQKWQLSEYLFISAVLTLLVVLSTAMSAQQLSQRFPRTITMADDRILVASPGKTQAYAFENCRFFSGSLRDDTVLRYLGLNNAALILWLRDSAKFCGEQIACSVDPIRVDEWKAACRAAAIVEVPQRESVYVKLARVIATVCISSLMGFLLGVLGATLRGGQIAQVAGHSAWWAALSGLFVFGPPAAGMSWAAFSEYEERRFVFAYYAFWLALVPAIGMWGIAGPFSGASACLLGWGGMLWTFERARHRG